MYTHKPCNLVSILVSIKNKISFSLVAAFLTTEKDGGHPMTWILPWSFESVMMCASWTTL